jgi:hypothetical protein
MRKYQYDDSYFLVENYFPIFANVEDEEAFIHSLNHEDAYCLHHRYVQ